MKLVLNPKCPPKRLGDPAWELALLYPPQGQWTEADYFDLCRDTAPAPRLFELAHGSVEVLPTPEVSHQRLVAFVYRTFHDCVRNGTVGEVHLAPLPIRLWENHLRTPDVVFFRKRRIRSRSKPPDGADLVVEVTGSGPENRARDLKDKRREYARAGIPEYWIVDSDEKTVTVLTLGTRRYRTHGVFRTGETATSATLDGFAVDVAALFAAGEGK